MTLVPENLKPSDCLSFTAKVAIVERFVLLASTPGSVKSGTLNEQANPLAKTRQQYMKTLDLRYRHECVCLYLAFSAAPVFRARRTDGGKALSPVRREATINCDGIGKVSKIYVRDSSAVD